MGVGAHKFLGAQRVLARISPNVSTKFSATFPYKITMKTFFGVTTRKSLQCFSLVLEKLRRNFCPYFQGFCRDFRGFLPDIQQIIFLGDALALLAPPPPITLLC